MENNSKKEKVFFVILWSIPVLFMVTLFIINLKNPEPKEYTIKVQESAHPNYPLSEIIVEGRSAFVKDLNTGETLYDKNSEIPLPLASLTKIMTTLVSQNVSEGVDSVFISQSSPYALRGEKLYTGETFSLQKLIDYTLVSSSNDGAAAIAKAVQNISNSNSFVDKMNILADDIGMKSTYFLNETGLDENSNQAGAYGSAHDVATLIEYTLKNYPQSLEATKDAKITTHSVSGFLHQAANTNNIIGQLPNVIASKTGYTDIAGGNLAVVIDPGLNRPIVIVVLGSSEEGRFNDVELLAKGVSKYFSLEE